MYIVVPAMHSKSIQQSVINIKLDIELTIAARNTHTVPIKSNRTITIHAIRIQQRTSSS